MGVELAIVLEDPERRYRPRDVVRGVVRVSADRPTKCEGVDIYARWYADHPAVAGSRGTGLVAAVYRGELAAGTHEHPFEIALPRNAFAGRGREMTLEWRLEARAFVSGFDPMTATRLRLAAPSPWGCRFYFEHVPDDPKAARANLTASVVGVLLALGVLGASALLGSGDGRLLGLGMGAMLLLTTSVWTLQNRKAVAAYRAFGDVRVSLRRERRGADPVTVSVSLGAGKRASEAVAAFKVEEFVKSGGDSQTSRSAHTDLCKPIAVRLAPTDDGGFEGAVPLPVGMPFSVHSDSAGFRWHLAVRLKTAEGLRWERDLPIQVLPFYPDEDAVVRPGDGTPS